MSKTPLKPPTHPLRTTERRTKKPCKMVLATTRKNPHKMMNSVVKGVSKLSLCKPPSSCGPVDNDSIFWECGNDDGSHTTETATSASRSSGDSNSFPSSPNQMCSERSGHSQASIAAPLPSIAQADCQPYAETVAKWSEERQQQFSSKQALSTYQQESDDESGILRQSDEDGKMKPGGWNVDAFIGNVDAFMDDDDDDDDDDFSRPASGLQDLFFTRNENGTYEDPPMAAQTEFARQQLLNSSAYRELCKKCKRQNKRKEKEQELEYDDYVDDDDEMYFDEVEISRGLGGYEEGFGVPTMTAHEYHHLPFLIVEEDELSAASSNLGLGPRMGQMFSVPATRADSIIGVGTGPIDQTVEHQPSRGNIACYHCRRGTCGNEDCSGSRFMI